MIRQLIKMLWNRKKHNFLLIVEIMVSFLVIAVITTMCVYYYMNYSRPLGFDYRNVWNIKTNLISRTEEWDAADTGTLMQLYGALRDFPGIEFIGTCWPNPFEIPEWNSVYSYGDRGAMTWCCNASLDFDKVLRVAPVQGRWFEASDRAAGIGAAVVNRALAEKLIGNTNPIGKVIAEGGIMPGEGDSRSKKQYRIVGVVENFKIKGELWDNKPVSIFLGKDLNEPKAMENFLVRVSPGSTAELEERIIERFRGISRDLTVKIERLDDSRRSYFRRNLIPLIVAGMVAFFLLLMVSLGLVGVLWLNVAKRGGKSA